MSVHVTRKAFLGPTAALILWACTALAYADAVTDWNRIAQKTVGRRLDTLATMNAAMFEALNFVSGRYRPRFVVASRGFDDLSPDAVAAAAAHLVLVKACPNRKAALDAALRASLDALPAGGARDVGVVAGESVAALVRAVAPFASGARDAGPPGWNALVTELIAARALPADERARLHALTSLVVAEAYRIAARSPGRCAPCIAAASVAYVLAAEAGAGALESGASDSDRALGRALARAALGRYYTPLSKP